MSSAEGELADLTAAQLKVVRGEPDDVELAALIAGIVAARGTPNHDSPASAPAPWRQPARRLGLRITGADAWRWSLHP